VAKTALLLDGRSLTLADAGRVLAGERFAVRLSPTAARRVAASNALVARAVRSGDALYGINTGFGKLARVRIDDANLELLQHNLIVSHAAGVGEPLDPDVARLALLLRANTLATGHSGVRRDVIDRLATLFQRGVAPWIPAQGSVGASGDLAPLAHLALLLIGRGRAWLDGQLLSGAELATKLRLKPLVLGPKEGLALINGTQISTAIAVAGLIGAKRLAKTADIAVALSLEALRGSSKPFDARIHALRPHPGQIETAKNVRQLLRGSKVLPSHAHCEKVQDPYCLRCAPQVHGAVRDAIRYAEAVLVREMNSVTDNPLLFPDDGDVLTGGNFHAEPVAFAADMLAIATAELANIAERRIENMVNPDLSGGLPAFLAAAPGLNSGLMIAQVTAAALVSENKTLAHPASVDSIPTSAGKEDHVSMATWAARKLLRVVENTEHVFAIELIAAAQALDLWSAWLNPGKGAHAAYRAVRVACAKMTKDREVAPDISRVREFVRGGQLISAVEHACGRID
jgi:histidine ammonia-lyase